jgi:hypothetical protein
VLRPGVDGHLAGRLASGFDDQPELHGG